MTLRTDLDVPELRTVADIERKLFLQPLPRLIAKLSYYRRLERAWQLIEENYSDPDLKLETAARVCGISKNHLNVLLRKTSSFTFYQLLVRYRLLQAITFMKSKNYSLIEVVLANGFKSLTTFERNFRSLLGVTPRKLKGDRDFW